MADLDTIFIYNETLEEYKSIIAEKDKQIQKLQHVNRTLKNFTESIFNEEVEKSFVRRDDVEEIINKFQKEFNKAYKELDIQAKQVEIKDYYKWQNAVTTMQVLAYCRDALQEMLDKYDS